MGAADKGVYWVNYDLGYSAADFDFSIILLVPDTAGTASQARLSGTLTATRGDVGAYNSLKTWHVAASRAYSSLEGSLTPLSEDTAPLTLIPAPMAAPTTSR